MIKAGGIWVSPAEVEATLDRPPRRAGSRGRRCSQRRRASRKPSPSSSPAPGARIDPARSTPTAASTWPRSNGPRQLFVVDELPKTATGKIQRFKLRDGLTA